jgi:hypothetical protein
MALIETKIDYSSDMLFLSFSGMPTLQVNLRCSKESCEERISCSVWSSECIVDVVAGGGEWFCHYLSVSSGEFRLVRMA